MHMHVERVSCVNRLDRIYGRRPAGWQSVAVRSEGKARTSATVQRHRTHNVVHEAMSLHGWLDAGCGELPCTHIHTQSLPPARVQSIRRPAKRSSCPPATRPLRRLLFPVASDAAGRSRGEGSDAMDDRTAQRQVWTLCTHDDDRQRLALSPFVPDVAAMVARPHRVFCGLVGGGVYSRLAAVFFCSRLAGRQPSTIIHDLFHYSVHRLPRV